MDDITSFFLEKNPVIACYISKGMPLCLNLVTENTKKKGKKIQDNVKFAKMKPSAQICKISGCCFQISGIGPEKH